VSNGTEPRQPVSRSGGWAENSARQSTGGNEPLTITAEVAVIDQLGAERRRSSTETRMYGLAVRLRLRSRNKLAPGTPARALLIGSADLADAGLCQSLRMQRWCIGVRLELDRLPE
jgi:hypothetical protein